MSKKSLSFFCASLFCLSFLAPLSGETSEFTGRLNASKVRLRTSPTLEGHVVRETTSGEMFAVVGEDNEFYKIIPSRDTRGYIFRTFVLEGTVEGERVNVRLYPDIDAPIIARLNTGDQIHGEISSINPKWYEIDLPAAAHFYVAKEYVENIGPIEVLAQMEARHNEATHLLSSHICFAQSQVQKPFEELDLKAVSEKFEYIVDNYSEFPDIVEKAIEASTVLQESFVQKKIAFLEAKADRTVASLYAPDENLAKLYEMKEALSPSEKGGEMDASPLVNLESVTGQMRAWVPFEESLYHLWKVEHPDATKMGYIAEEQMKAVALTGVVESYSRPVKNRPGDYLLRLDSMSTAFLYSTQVNLEEMVGQKVTVKATPRANNNFAFPAYHVLSLE